MSNSDDFGSLALYQGLRLPFDGSQCAKSEESTDETYQNKQPREDYTEVIPPSLMSVQNRRNNHLGVRQNR